MATKKRRNRNRKAPNVYVQAQREREELERPDPVSATLVDQPGTESTAATASPVSTKTSRPRASRLTQTTRSDVYAVSIPNEIRKMGILTAGVVVALVVFSILLG